MYKKSMREALEEARQYTAIHEVKVSKGSRTLDISKDDLPVYRAKGWKLAEELVTEFKTMTVRIRDKNKMNKAMKDLDRLSAKQNLGLAVLDKGMHKVIKVYGNNQDLNNIARDLKNFYGAEIKAESVELEEKVEYIEYKFRNSREAVAAVRFVQAMNTGVPRNLDINSDGENRGIIVFDAGKDDFTRVHKMIVQRFRPQILAVEKKEEELEERFTIGDYKRLEADNQHDVAAKKLVDKFGTPEDKKEIDAINKRHNKTGYITGPDFKKRTQIVNKYFSKLMPWV